MPVSNSLISIITPTFQAGATLAETLESVVIQQDSDQQGEVEHFLIDAVSSDGTLEIAARFPHLKVISERDCGIYDGMNKGARLAQGDWLLFLQADDWLPDGTLEVYITAIRDHPDADIICGGAEAQRRDSGIWKTVWTVNDEVSKKLTLENIALREPMINARLIRRDCFLKLGGFSLEYSLASDRDFLLRAAREGVLQVEIPAMTYRYRWHAGSRTMTTGNALSNRLSEENLAIAKNHLSDVGLIQKKVLIKWHSRLTVQAAMNALETPGLKGLLPAIIEGSRKNPFWVLNFILEIALKLPGFLLRGGKSRSALIREKKQS